MNPSSASARARISPRPAHSPTRAREVPEPRSVPAAPTAGVRDRLKDSPPRTDPAIRAEQPAQPRRRVAAGLLDSAQTTARGRAGGTEASSGPSKCSRLFRIVFRFRRQFVFHFGARLCSDIFQFFLERRTHLLGLPPCFDRRFNDGPRGGSKERGHNHDSDSGYRAPEEGSPGTRSASIRWRRLRLLDVI